MAQGDPSTLFAFKGERTKEEEEEEKEEEEEEKEEEEEEEEEEMVRSTSIESCPLTPAEG